MKPQELYDREQIGKLIKEAWGITFVIRWIAFKIYPNVEWWTKSNPEGLSNIDVLYVVTLFVLPYITFLWFIVKPIVERCV